MKRIIAIILIIIAIGVTIFALLYLRSTQWIIEDIKDDVNIETVQETTENWLQEEEKEEQIYQENLQKTQPQIKKEENIEQEWQNLYDEYDKNEGKLFLYLEGGWEPIFKYLVKKNQDWSWKPFSSNSIQEVNIKDLDLNNLEFFDTQSLNDNIDVEYYTTDNFRNKFNEKDGIMKDISYNSIEFIDFNYFTNVLSIEYTDTLSKELNKTNLVEYKVNLIIEDKRHKINDLELIYDTGRSPQPYFNGDITPILTLINDKYNLDLDPNKYILGDGSIETPQSEYKFSKKCLKNIKNKDLCPNIEGKIVDWSTNFTDKRTDKDIFCYLILTTNNNGKLYDYHYIYDIQQGENKSFNDFNVTYVKKVFNGNEN